VHHGRAIHSEPLRGLSLRRLSGEHRDVDLVLLARRQPSAWLFHIHLWIWIGRPNCKLITKLKLRRMLPIMQFDKPNRRETIQPAFDQ